MKKILTICSVLAVMIIAGTTSAKAESYTINDEAVNAVFESAIAAPISVDYINNAIPNTPTEQAKVSGGKNPWVAFALAFVLGQLGVHRFYMGTAVLTGIGYILTLGGCGVVAFVDWIVLLIGAIEKDISKYEDNTKFFMW